MSASLKRRSGRSPIPPGLFSGSSSTLSSLPSNMLSSLRPLALSPPPMPSGNVHFPAPAAPATLSFGGSVPSASPTSTPVPPESSSQLDTSSPIFLRRGRNSADTPATAAARKDRDADRRDRRARIHSREEDVSSTPPLSKFRQRYTGVYSGQSPTTSGLSAPPAFTPYGFELDSPSGPMLARRGSISPIRGRRSSLSYSRSSRSSYRSLSPQPGLEWFYCLDCKILRSNYFLHYSNNRGDGYGCKYCFDLELSVDRMD
jgi:hypothetical protein